MAKTEMTQWLTQEDLLAMFGVGRTTIDRWMDTKGFPQFFRHGNGRRWDAAQVEAWARRDEGGSITQCDAANAARARAQESASEAA